MKATMVEKAAQTEKNTLELSFALFMLFVCINAVLLILFWDDYGASIVVSMAGFYASLAAVLGLVIVRRIRRGAETFAATREVLEKDRRALRELP